MAWLFERTIELAAWVAMIAAWVAAVVGVVRLVRWFGTLQTEPDYSLLYTSGRAAAAAIGFAIALGILACIDRYIFDADEVKK